MKKILFLWITILFILLITIRVEADYDLSQHIKFYDSNLEKTIRNHLDKPIGKITKSDVINITELDLSSKQISDLRGLENFSYLEELSLSHNNLSPNTIHVLGSLIYLKKLNLRETGITNITFLRNLLMIKYLNLHSNPIQSIEPLKHLSKLEELIIPNINVNEQLIYIKDLNRLSRLNVRNSSITDFSVIISLMQKGALQGEGSVLDISQNPGLNQARAGLIPYWSNVSDPNPIKLDGLLPPSFSKDSGFYTEEFQLTLESYNKNTFIFYTLDGSEPDPTNLHGKTYFIKQSYPNGLLEQRSYQTFLYKDSIRVYDRTQEDNYISKFNTTYTNNFFSPTNKLFKANVIRAKTCDFEGACSETITNTYFVNKNIKTKYRLPIVSIVTNEDQLFDYTKGIYVAGKVYNDWKINHPSWNPDGGTPANYNQRGDNWERTANLSFFENDGTLGFTQNIGLRIQGAYSRAFARKSMRVYARSEYDEKNTINYNLFPGLSKQSDDEEFVKDFKRLVLRNGGNHSDGIFYTDAFMHKIVSHLSFDTQGYRPAIQFVNGEYFGIINIRERYDENYLYSHYGIEEQDAVIMTNYGEVEVGDGSDATDMLHLRDFVLNKEMNNVYNYNYVKSKIDIDNFIEYQVANIYFANTDWPGNNVRYWRKRTTSTTNGTTAYGHDGKWRFMMYDTDFGFGTFSSYSHDTLTFASQVSYVDWPNPPWSTALLRGLLKNNEFKKQFVNTFADQMNTSFEPERVEELLDDIHNEIAFDLLNHNLRWNTPRISNYNLLEFGKRRPQYMTNYINNYFKLGGTVNVNLSNDHEDQGFIRINSIDIKNSTPGVKDPNNWTGQYFKNNEIKITAIPNSGYKFVAWEGIQSTNPSISITLKDNLQLKAIFTEDLDYVIHFDDINLNKALTQIFNKEKITIKDMMLIKELDLSNANISSLEGLHYAIYLNHLNLSQNNITSLEPIKDLIHLKSLKLDSNLYIENMNIVRTFTKLESLDLRNTNIQDIQFLIPLIEQGELKNRNQVDLRDNPIKNGHLLDLYWAKEPLIIPPNETDKQFNYYPIIISSVFVLITIPVIFAKYHQISKKRRV